ncbi:MAG: histidinol dehydrogenase [Candidatus Bathyarchaeales archaeon]
MKTENRKKQGEQPIIKVWDASSTQIKWIERVKALQENSEVEKQVKAIIEEVKKRGDAALIKFTKEFDSIQLNARDLRVTPGEIEKAYEKVAKEQVFAIEAMKERLETVEKLSLKQAELNINLDNIGIRYCLHPIESVGCYVPGGRASYPSTLIMTAAPAKLAGVSRVVVCSPPNVDGTLNPLTLVAADICKVDEVYKVGGAQAIAAMAYGTESIKPVRKIVGPGNKYVTMAKILVSRDVAVDMPAGPSELLVLADETANPRFVALDMCSQAEHGPDSVVGLITTSSVLAGKVIAEIENIAYSIPRSDIVAKALANNGFVIVCENVDTMVELANVFAPEHVEIVTRSSEEVAEKLLTAGLILIGSYSPVSLSDYYSGTNHVLPTGGFGKTFSGLSALDFVRKVVIVNCSKEGLRKALEPIKVLAEAENLPNHYRAVEGRFKVEDSK